MDWNSALKEAIPLAALATPVILGLVSAVAYPGLRWRATRVVSKSCGVDASRIDRGHATRIWLNLYQPPLFFIPRSLPSPELKEIVGGFSYRISGVQDEELRHAALDELVQDPLVRSYLLI